MDIKRTFRLIKRNPFGCLVATTVSLPIVAVILFELCTLPVSRYSLNFFKESIADASGVAPEIKKFKMDIVKGECILTKVKIFNSSKFDAQSYATENVQNQKRIPEMVEFKTIKIKIEPLSIFDSKPVVKEFDAEIEKLNAIIMTPKVFNLTLFMKGMADKFSVKNGALDKFSLKIIEPQDKSANISYLDFSRSKNIINVKKAEGFSFEQNSPKEIKTTLAELSEKLKTQTSMFFFSKAINSVIEE